MLLFLVMFTHRIINFCGQVVFINIIFCNKKNGGTGIFEPLKNAPMLYIMEMLTTLFRAKLTTGLADFWVAANAIKACTKIVI